MKLKHGKFSASSRPINPIHLFRLIESSFYIGIDTISFLVRLARQVAATSNNEDSLLSFSIQTMLRLEETTLTGMASLPSN